MKQVDLIRQRILRGLTSEMDKLRVYISTLPENQPVVDKLRDPNFVAELHADLTDLILRKLGHDPGQPKERRFSKTYRAARQL